MKNIFSPFAFIFLLSVNGFSQPAKLSQPHSSFVSIVVSNIDNSINWYSSNFGLMLKNKGVSKERGFKQANLSGGQVHIELVELKSALSRKEILANRPGNEIQGFVKFGFYVNDFDHWHHYMVKQKVKLFGGVVKDPQTGKRMFIVTDPDGNKIQVFEE